MGKPSDEETITYDGICPYCNAAVVGELKPGNVCITTFCDVCDRFLLEDEVDWGEDKDAEELDFTKIPSRYIRDMEEQIKDFEEGGLDGLEPVEPI